MELLSTWAGDHDGSPGGVGRLGEQSEKFIRVLEESTLRHDGDVHGWQERKQARFLRTGAENDCSSFGEQAPS